MDETPGVAINWPSGAPDTSNEWVAALVEAHIAIAYATNTHDFSIEIVGHRLTDDLGELYASSTANFARLDDSSPAVYYYHAGPQPFNVTDIEEDQDLAVIETCELESPDWRIYQGGFVTNDEIRATEYGGYGRYTLVREDGTIKLSDVQKPDGVCTLGAVRPGFFDPPPPVGDPVMIDAMIGRDGEAMG